MGREVEAEFWIQEDSGEDVERRRVGAVVDVGRWGQDDAGTFAFPGEGDGVGDAVG